MGAATNDEQVFRPPTGLGARPPTAPAKCEKFSGVSRAATFILKGPYSGAAFTRKRLFHRGVPAQAQRVAEHVYGGDNIR